MAKTRKQYLDEMEAIRVSMWKQKLRILAEAKIQKGVRGFKKRREAIKRSNSQYLKEDSKVITPDAINVDLSDDLDTSLTQVSPKNPGKEFKKKEDHEQAILVDEPRIEHVIHEKQNKGPKNLAETQEKLDSHAKEPSHVSREAFLTIEERYILEEGAKNIALWAAAVLPHHITEPFGKVHHELFSLLYHLVTGKQQESITLFSKEKVQKEKEDQSVRQGGGDVVAPVAVTELTPTNIAAVSETVDNKDNEVLSGCGDDIKDKDVEELENGEIVNKVGDVDSKVEDWEVGSGSRLRKLVVALPRNHAKTTCLMVCALWCVCYRQKWFVVLVSDTEDQAKLQLDAIKAELEGNERLRRLYGDLVGPYWGMESIETSTGIRVQCRGAGQKIRGLKFRQRRPDLIILDDILNEELVETEERRLKLKRWFFGTVVPAVAIGGGIVVAGTILHESDLLSELLESGVGWKKVRYEATGLDGLKPVAPVLWFERYDLKYFEDLREEYAEKGELSLYYREHYNRIVGNEASPFRREMFQYVSYEELEHRGDTRNFLTVDPAYTVNKKSDYSVFCVVGLDSKKNWYVKAIVRGKWQMPRMIDQWFEVVRTYQPVMIGIQNIDWNRMFRSVMQDEMRRRNVFFAVKELQTFSPVARGLSNKVNRINRLTKYYSSRSIFHMKAGLGISELENELLSHPYSKHDDCADALSLMVDLVFPPREKLERSYPEFLDRAQVDPVSGY